VVYIYEPRSLTLITIAFAHAVQFCVSTISHNKDFKPYSSTNVLWIMKPRKMRLAGHVVKWERGEVHTGLWWGKPEATIYVGIPSRRLQDNIKMDFKKYDGGVDRFDPAHYRDDSRVSTNMVLFLKMRESSY
jgi:hypothetical protein